MGLFERFLHALYPEDVACVLCNREAETDALGLCEDCALAVRPAPPSFCPDGLDGMQTFFSYEGPVCEGVSRLKYGGAAYLGKSFARFMALDPAWRATALLPVPLWPGKERARGYNQSLLLAEALGERAGCPVRKDLLIRVRDTGSQTALHRQARAENMKDAFFAPHPLTGMRLVLIDDVFTTGATLSECTRCCKAAGAEAVFALCFAATPPPGEGPGKAASQE